MKSATPEKVRGKKIQGEKPENGIYKALASGNTVTAIDIRLQISTEEFYAKGVDIPCYIHVANGYYYIEYCEHTKSLSELNGGIRATYVELWSPPMRTPPSGFYYGIAGGMITRFAVRGLEYKLTMEEGVRGIGIPVLVVVKDGQASVVFDKKDMLKALEGESIEEIAKGLLVEIQDLNKENYLGKARDFFIVLRHGQCKHLSSKIERKHEHYPGENRREWEDRVCTDCGKILETRMIQSKPGEWRKT